MKYAKDIVVNKLQDAIASNDVNTALAIIADQTTDMAINSPKLLHAAIKDSGIKVSNSNDAKYLSHLVADNLGNKELIKRIASFIITPETFQNAKGDGIDAEQGMAIGNMLAGLVGQLGSAGIAMAGQVKAAKETTKQTAEATKQAAEATKASMNNMLGMKAQSEALIEQAKAMGKNAEKKVESFYDNNKTAIWISVASVVLLGVGLGAYFMLRPKSSEVIAPAIK